MIDIPFSLCVSGLNWAAGCGNTNVSETPFLTVPKSKITLSAGIKIRSMSNTTLKKIFSWQLRVADIRNKMLCRRM